MCKNVYSGMVFGFMCRRTVGHTGRHSWWITGKVRTTVMYWKGEAS